MLKFINQVIDDEKPWLSKDDTLENILNDLSKYTLNSTFERYGNFIYKPTFRTQEQKDNWIKTYGEDAVCVFGNFATYSHAFNLITDEIEIIKQLTKAIKSNQNSEAYINLKNKIKTDAIKEYEETKQKYNNTDTRRSIYVEHAYFRAIDKLKEVFNNDNWDNLLLDINKFTKSLA